MKEAIDRGVDIRIVHEPAGPASRRQPGSRPAGLDAGGLRTKRQSFIAHNKFIVKLENGQPVAVWTGGTNFSDGGIFGHSNVAHLVEEPLVAGKFMEYWTALEADPP